MERHQSQSNPRDACLKTYRREVFGEDGLSRNVKVRALEPRQNSYYNESLNTGNHACYDGESYQDTDTPVVRDTPSKELRYTIRLFPR
jgi:hypothetical protein